MKDLFTGERIRLAAFRPEDLDLMFTWQESYTYLANVDTEFTMPKTLKQLQDAEEQGSSGNTFVQFCLRTLQDDQLIGFVALHSIEWNNQMGSLAVGIGDPAYRGQGYGAEAIELLLQFAFLELNMNRVGLDVIAYNKSAMRAYEKVGFQREGAMRSAVLRFGRAYDRIIMGILRDEWLALHPEIGQQPS